MALATTNATSAPFDSTPRSGALVHRVLADALKMRSLGNDADALTARLLSFGLTESEASRAVVEIERHVEAADERGRRIRLRALVGICAQVVLIVVMMALHLVVWPLISVIVLGTLFYRAWVHIGRPQSLRSAPPLFG